MAVSETEIVVFAESFLFTLQFLVYHHLKLSQDTQLARESLVDSASIEILKEQFEEFKKEKATTTEGKIL